LDHREDQYSVHERLANDSYPTRFFIIYIIGYATTNSPLEQFNKRLKAEVNKLKRLPIKQSITYMKITVSVEVTNDPFSQKIVFSRKVVERAKKLFESSRLQVEGLRVI
jgi:hypothetical protein